MKTILELFKSFSSLKHFTSDPRSTRNFGEHGYVQNVSRALNPDSSLKKSSLNFNFKLKLPLQCLNFKVTRRVNFHWKTFVFLKCMCATEWKMKHAINGINWKRNIVANGTKWKKYIHIRIYMKRNGSGSMNRSGSMSRKLDWNFGPKLKTNKTFHGENFTNDQFPTITVFKVPKLFFLQADLNCSRDDCAIAKAKGSSGRRCWEMWIDLMDFRVELEQQEKSSL